MPVFCPATRTGGCNGRITITMVGSRPAGKHRRVRFSYVLKTVFVSLRAGQKRTLVVRYPKRVRTAIGRALRARGGQVVARVRVRLKQ
jgi:hypothetical protein